MLIENNFVSISELRDQTAKVVKEVGKYGKKIVLFQNKPIGIILSIEEYNSLQKLGFEKEKATTEDIKAYQKSSHGKDGVEAFSFLEGLK